MTKKDEAPKTPEEKTSAATIRTAVAMDVPMDRAAITVGPKQGDNYAYADIEPFGGRIGYQYETLPVDGRDDLLEVNIGGRWIKVSVDQPGEPGYVTQTDSRSSSTTS